MFNTAVGRPFAASSAPRRPGVPLGLGAAAGAGWGAAAGAAFGVSVAGVATSPIGAPEADLLGWAGMFAIYGPVGGVLGALLGALPGLLCGVLVAVAAPWTPRHLARRSVAVFLLVTVGGTLPVLLSLADPGDDVPTALAVLCLPLPFAAAALALHARQITRHVWRAPAREPG